MKNLTFIKSFCFAAVFCAAAMFAAPAAFACQPCRIEKSLDLKQTIERADLIVTGNRIFSPEDKLDKTPEFIKLQFLRVLKGKVAETQAKARSHFGMCPYGVVVPDAAQYVFFLNDIDPKENFYGAVERCSFKTLRLDGANNETITLDNGKTKIPLDEFAAETIAPPEYKTIVKFLQFLKNGEDEDAFGFDVNNGGKWDAEKLLSFVSANGVTLSNVNRKPPVRRLTFAELRRSLAGKRDDVWQRFVHLGHIYKQAYPQYSTVNFISQPNHVIAELTAGYRLTFSREQNALKLSKLEYLQIEGD